MSINLQEIVMSRRLSDRQIDELHEMAAQLGAELILALVDEVRIRRGCRRPRQRGIRAHG